MSNAQMEKVRRTSFDALQRSFKEGDIDSARSFFSLFEAAVRVDERMEAAREEAYSVSEANDPAGR